MPVAILAHGKFLEGEAKTAEALIRYGRDPVTCVIDEAAPEGGVTAGSVVPGAGASVPVVPDIEAALDTGPDRLAIGVAPVGGRLPKTWRQELTVALTAGLDVAAGLHDFLSQDPELSALAEANGASIEDIRRPPEGKPIYSGEVLDLEATVVLTVGTDCSSGKMTTTVEVARELADRGREVAFVATGQTGIMIGSDAGVVIDAVPADFVSGWTERLVLEAYEATGAEVILVEGQGAITHPAYAGVSLGLLHGASPHGCLLCHDVTRHHKTTSFADGRTFPVHDPLEEWALIKQLAGAIRPPQLLGVSAMHKAKASHRLEKDLAEVPLVDVLNEGPGDLADNVEAIL